MRRRSGSACSPTDIGKSPTAARSRSSTPAASLTRPSRSRVRLPRARPAARAPSTSRVAPRGSSGRSTVLPPTSSSPRRTGDDAAAFVAGDVGAIGCVNAEHRLDRVRAFVRIQDGCSFSCAFCVIPLVRGGTRSRTRGGRARRDPPPRRAGTPRDRPHGCQPRLLPRPCRGLHARAPRARGRRDARARAAPALVDRGQSRRRRARRRADARHRPSRRTSTCRCNRATMVCSERWAAATPSAQFPRRLAPLAHFNLTTDVIVGFPAEDEAAFARTLELVERARDHEGARVPVLTTARDPNRRCGHGPGRGEAGPRRPAAGAVRRARAVGAGRRRVGTTDRVLVDRPGRGYADDYTPWLVDAPVGAFVTARAVGVAAEGVLAVAA